MRFFSLFKEKKRNRSSFAECMFLSPFLRPQLGSRSIFAWIEKIIYE